jgi:sulfide:quinone oxidoreductase
VANNGAVDASKPAASHDIVIVGGGAAGAAVAASLLRRRPDLDIAVIDPAATHYYQPGWTMVGAGIFTPEQTAKSMAAVLPRRVSWIKAAVAGFDPEQNSVVIEGCRAIRYNHLVVCPGIKLDWSGIEGLTATLGRNGVTSNYRYDLAPYTWELVRSLRSGRALFTQPPMPIKCAGAPQKAMYLSADHWLRNGRLQDIDVAFYNAGGVLFGVADYVPALMDYVRRYDAALNFNHTLVAIDGPQRKAWFKKAGPDGPTVETSFDMIHVCPPQLAPDFVRASPLADSAGWVDVDHATLQHKRYANVYGLGDATCTPNAKTAAAARKQAPVVAENILFAKGLRDRQSAYDGYGSCPLTVERGKIVLAEFTYGGKLAPTFPTNFLDGTKPSRAAWILKERILPPVYWRAMLKGREWLAKPKVMA